MPSTAGLPLTVSRPARIHASASRREASPSCASTFCTRSATGVAAIAREPAASVGLVGGCGDQARGARLGGVLVGFRRVGIGAELALARILFAPLERRGR